jgi:hypothetical protein
MKRTLFTLLAGLFITAQIHAAHFDVLWIGNSLTQGSPGCQGEGWMWPELVMVNPDSLTLGVGVYPAAVMRGATDLPSHWRQDIAAGDVAGTGRGELSNPSGNNMWDPEKSWMASRSNYDYVILQGYHWSAPYNDDIDTASLYASFALQHGVKPLFFACWQDPANYAGVTGAYDSLYRKFRSQGAILAPVFQAHKLVLDDKGVTAGALYLYGAEASSFHHDNATGAYLKMCIFYELFTGQSAVGLQVTHLKASCWDAAALGVAQADADYCSAKAHQALVNYYGAGNIPHFGSGPVAIKEPVQKFDASPNRSSINGYYDLTGRFAGRPDNAQKAFGAYVASDDRGNLHRILINR